MVEYYLILSTDLNYVSGEQYQQTETPRGEAGCLLHRLIQSLVK